MSSADRMRRSVVSAGAVLGVLLVAGCSSGADPAPAASSAAAPSAASTGPATGSGRSVVVLGHSGATGYNTDPANGGRDVNENSWATGTNPAVNSVYRRLAVRDPRYAGHAANLARDGATVQDLLAQARNVPGVHPAAGAVFVEIVDNDIRCDGTDAQNYAPFARTLTQALQTISTSAPDAQIYLTSVWGTADSYARAVAPIPAARQENTGTGPCDLFDSAGRLRPTAATYLQNVVEHYQQQLARVCRTLPSCHYDNGALQAFPVTAADLTPDHNHLSISGHQKYADLVWKAFFT